MINPLIRVADVTGLTLPLKFPCSLANLAYGAGS